MLLVFVGGVAFPLRIGCISGRPVQPTLLFNSGWATFLLYMVVRFFWRTSAPLNLMPRLERHELSCCYRDIVENEIPVQLGTHTRPVRTYGLRFNIVALALDLGDRARSIPK